MSDDHTIHHVWVARRSKGNWQIEEFSEASRKWQVYSDHDRGVSRDYAIKKVASLRRIFKKRTFRLHQPKSGDIIMADIL